MSIAALGEESLVASDPEVVRSRLEPQILQTVDKLRRHIDLGSADLGQVKADLTPLAETTPLPKNKATTAVDGLARFIPTEAITLYVAAGAAMPALKATFPGQDGGK